MSGKKQIINQLIGRKPLERYWKLAPQAQLKRAQYSKSPEPLVYKKDQEIPFKIFRSENGNLPIYRKYFSGRENPRTVIRKIEGDIDAFTNELRKVCSNADVHQKIGRVEVSGSHIESVRKWLLGLGF
ncbi:hypothetical protein pb186bvf_013759 [Paramecium bursaria]